MQRYLFYISFIILLNCTNESTNKIGDVQPIENKNEWHCKVIMTENGQWGYEVFNGGQKVIGQTIIPGAPGMNGFQSREDAKKVADWVVHKLQTGQFPPSIYTTDLDSLNIHY